MNREKKLEKMFIMHGKDKELSQELFHKSVDLFNSYPKHVGMSVLNDMYFNVIFRLNITKEKFLESVSDQWDFEKGE